MASTPWSTSFCTCSSYLAKPGSMGLVGQMIHWILPPFLLAVPFQQLFTVSLVAVWMTSVLIPCCSAVASVSRIFFGVL